MINFAKDLAKHVANWTEVYFWVPVSLMSIYLMALMAFWLSGRAPMMNLDWFPELGANLFKCILSIALTSIAKQALWTWFTTEQKLEMPLYAIARQLIELVVLLMFVWIMFNR